MNLSRLKNARGFLLGTITTGALAFFIQAKPVDSYFEISKNMDIFSSLFKELNTLYVDPIEPGKMIKTGIDAMLSDLDPYTNYITESDIEDFEFQTTGKYGGIGAIMRQRDGQTFVGEVHDPSPAQKAGIHPGDEVLTVDNQAIKGKNLDQISLLLKGAPGTQVTLKIKDAYTGAEAQKILTRGEIEISSVPFFSLVGKNKDVAYVTLTQFTPGCSRLVRSALDSLKTLQPNLKGIVLDLRNNPGGLLDEAVSVCNLFIDRGQLIVSTKGKMAEWDKEYKTTGTPWDSKMPLTVLVNNYSASASEIVAGAVQDLDRGVVIGNQSYGKGLVQITRPLGYNARVKLTTAKYYTPSGRCIQAIDYSHRNPDGSVGKIPDSLKKSYATRAGRKVLSGGGVAPDIDIADTPVSKLTATLYMKNYFFDYATSYAKQHPTIAPAGSFALTNADFDQFVKWLDNKDYTYKTETEIMLDSLKSIAIQEKYFDGMKSEYTALAGKVSHDKKQDLLKHKDEVISALENEIVSRYYYKRGRIENNMKTDNDLEKALSIIAQPAQYGSLLQAKK